MESTKLVLEKLKTLNELFPHLDIKYEYRGYLNTHIIQIEPVVDFNEDENYISFQIDFEKEFESRFDSEEILFITKNDLISVENPIVEYALSENDCHFELVTAIKIDYFIDDFEEYKIEINTPIDFEIPVQQKSKPWWRKFKESEGEDSGLIYYNLAA